MKKYRIIGNTSDHEFKIGAVVKHAPKFEWSSHNDWYTSDGTEKNTWGVKKADIEEIIPIFGRIVNIIKGWFHK